MPSPLNAFATAFTASVLLAAPALSAPAPVPDVEDRAIFDALDTDSSGGIDREEFAVWFSADDPEADAFGFFDLDHDGTITPDELDAMLFEVVAPETETALPRPLQRIG